ncbi:MAG: hypothetical protein ACLTAK_02195 [Bacilli bacterium]
MLWNGKVSMINISDYMKASLEEGCAFEITCGTKASACSTSNYLFNNVNEWFLSPWLALTQAVATVYSTGGFCNNGASLESFHVYPSIYLKSDIRLSGAGTKEEPYFIK